RTVILRRRAARVRARARARAVGSERLRLDRMVRARPAQYAPLRRLLRDGCDPGHFPHESGGGQALQRRGGRGALPMVPLTGVGAALHHRLPRPAHHLTPMSPAAPTSTLIPRHRRGLLASVLAPPLIFLAMLTVRYSLVVAACRYRIVRIPL